jgi:hypothetical protein
MHKSQCRNLKKKKTKAMSLFQYATVNSTGAVCDQESSKFFVSHQKESMAGQVGIKGVY